MATILTETFNDYNDGDLNGQGSWVGSTLFDIQGDVVKEGAKAVKCTVANTNNVNIYKIGDVTADGKTTVYVRVSSTSYTYVLINLKKADDSDYAISLKWAGTTLYYYGPGATTLKTGMVADHWYQIEIEWRSSDTKARYNIDSEGWSEYLAQEGNNAPGRVRFGIYGNGGGYDTYFDYVAEEPYVAVTNFTESCTEVLSLVGIPAQKYGGDISKTDILTLVDSITKKSTWKKLFVDTISLLDIVSIGRKFIETITDTISLADSIIKKLSFKKIFTNVVSLVDSIVKKFLFKKTFTDVISLSDIVSFVKRFVVTITDAISLIDSIAKKLTSKKIFTNVITLVDTISVDKAFKVVKTEILTLIESITKKSIWKKTITEVITLKDITSFIERIWTFAVKHTSTWTFKDKNESEYEETYSHD